MTSIDKIKKEVKKIKAKGKAARYPDDLISDILQLYRQGIEIEVLARQVGVSHQSIRFWLKRSQSDGSVSVSRFPKEQKFESNKLRLYFPDGKWVEGLSLDDIRFLQAQNVVSKKGA